MNDKPAILFVDDEPSLLQGLRLSLRKQRKVWNMAFAEDGAAALEALEKQPFDVVVSDMRMPRMDGGTLLQRVKTLQPQAIRIVLTGQADADAALRSIPVAHQFLCKPCDPVTVREVITRALGLRATLGRSVVQEVVGSLRDLPPPPEVYAKLRHLMAGEDASINAIAAVIEADIAMSARVLQVINSGFFGLSQCVTSVAKAVQYLGTGALGPLVLGLEAMARFDKVRRIPGFSLADEQGRAMESARIARRLLTNERDQDAATAAGMLADVGRLVLARQATAGFVEARQHAREAGIPDWQAERTVLGTDHAEVGGYLLGLWGLPYPVVEAVTLHHAPEKSGSSTFDTVGAVHVANALSGDSRSLDLAYLERVGVADRLPAWRQLAVTSQRAA